MNKEFKKSEKNLEGIGGWLILPAIGLMIGLIEALNRGFIFETFLLLVLNILFYGKFKIFRWLIIIYFFFAFLLTFSPKDFVSLIIWVPYFIFSKRVKNTFTKYLLPLFHKKKDTRISKNHKND